MNFGPLTDVPMLVHLDNIDELGQHIVVTKEKEAEHATGNTWILPSLGTVLNQQNNPAEILPLDIMRKRAVVTFNGSGQVIICHSQAQAQSMQQNVQQAADEGCLVTAPFAFVYEATAALWAVAVPASVSQNTVSASGKVTAPAAGATIASIPIASLPAGVYSVTGTVYLDGTVVAATDGDNMQLFANGGTYTQNLLVPGVASTPANFGPFLINANGLNNIKVIAIGAGSASAVYHALVVATPVPFVNSTGAVSCGTLVERRDQ